MKVIAITTAAFLFAGTAFGGALTYEEPVMEEEVMMEEPGGSGSGGWAIPLIFLAVVVAVAAS